MLSNVFDYQALFAEEFTSYLLEQKASEITRKNYLSDLRHFFAWLTTSMKEGNARLSEQDVKPLRMVTTETIENYKRSQLLTHTPSATINRRLSALRMFFQYALQHTLITDNPMLSVRNLPRTDNPNYVSSLETALAQFTKDQKATPMEIGDIQSFFSWYQTQCRS